MEFGDFRYVRGSTGVIAHRHLGVYRWNLQSQVDAFGNRVLYVHELDTAVYGGEIARDTYLTDIYYNSPANDALGMNVDKYQHHVELIYDRRSRQDIQVTYKPGFAVVTAWRLQDIRMETVPFGQAPSGGRELVRRYELRYDPQSYTSMLTALRMVGSDDVSSYPEMRFGYTQVEGEHVVPGFGAINGKLRALDSSPPYKLSQAVVDFFDLNADGLPDVLVSDTGRFNDHGLFFNRWDVNDNGGLYHNTGDVADAPWKQFHLANVNIRPMDVDGDGQIDLMHLPSNTDYAYYTLLPDGKGVDRGYRWQLQQEVPANQVDWRLDFSTKNKKTRLMDVNGDGRIDILKDEGTRISTWLNLTGLENGIGRFGSVSYRSSKDDYTLSKYPIDTPVLYKGDTIRFDDPRLKSADMNGDGIDDLVYCAPRQVFYWPGRGYGRFGVGDAVLELEAPSRLNGHEIEMAHSPQFHDENQVHFTDVNKDGYPDLVEVKHSSVRIFLNQGGRGFGKEVQIHGTPHPGKLYSLVRFADINGSGSADLVWGNSDTFQYIDFMSGQAPRLLNRFENGSGSVTTIEYESSTQQMIRAEKKGEPWQQVMPNPAWIVRKVTSSDSLGWQSQTEYEYRDPYYDGFDKAFKGFGEAVVTQYGDEDTPALKTRARYYQGKRPDWLCRNLTYAECLLADNPMKALQGTMRSSQSFDDAGRTYSATQNEYEITKLYDGKRERRGVWRARAKRTRSWAFDHDQWQDGPVTQEGMGWTVHIGKQTHEQEDSLTFNGTRFVETAEWSEVDFFGTTTKSVKEGYVHEMGDELSSRSVPVFNLEEWIFRTGRTWVEGNPDAGEPAPTLNEKAFFYDDSKEFGTVTRGALTATRVNEKGTSCKDSEVWSHLDWTTIEKKEYGLFGQLKRVLIGNNQGETEHEYDPIYWAYLTTEQMVLGDKPPLTSRAKWDAGLGAVTSMTDYNGHEHVVAYDALGRLTLLYRPECAEPAVVNEYEVIDRAYTRLVSKVNAVCEEPIQGTANAHSAKELSGVVMETVSFVDGLGRTRATFAKTDPKWDEGPWLLSGVQDLDARGNAIRSYFPTWHYQEPWDFDPNCGRDETYTLARYDASGRVFQSCTDDLLDCTTTTYGAGYTTVWDAEDLYENSDHYGTYGMQIVDGLGRVTEIHQTLANQPGGGPQQILATRVKYDSLGNIVQLIRQDLVKTVDYDVLGRIKVIHDPDAGDIRYSYNNIGELIGLEDARGIGSDFTYDRAGRLLTEDYGRDGTVDVEYHYDAPFEAEWYSDLLFDSVIPHEQENLLGRLSWMKDRSGHGIFSYDNRGRPSWSDRQISHYDHSAGQSKADLSKVYHESLEYGETDEVLRKIYADGAAVDFGYTNWGSALVLRTVDLTGALGGFHPLIAGMFVNKFGKVTNVRYGDYSKIKGGRHLEILKEYDPKRLRLRSLRALDVDNVQVSRVYQDLEYRYDRVSNITSIADLRDPATVRDWSAEPTSYSHEYDSLYRLLTATPEYKTLHNGIPRVEKSLATRAGRQSWTYDDLGNMATWNEFAPTCEVETPICIQSQHSFESFYRFDLGQIVNGIDLRRAGIEVDGEPARPHAMYGAVDRDDKSYLTVAYDAAGNMKKLEVYKGCVSCDGKSNACTHPCAEATAFLYTWDELGQLAAAQKFEAANAKVFEGEFDKAYNLSTHLSYTYDASGARVVKNNELTPDETALYVASDFEIRAAEWDKHEQRFKGGEVTKYAFAGEHRAARIVEKQDGTEIPGFAEQDGLYIYLNISNHLSSNSVTLDFLNGEVVHAQSELAFGGDDAEISQNGFEPNYEFTGKEKDDDIGLYYHGARYYNPLLARWTAADPLFVNNINASASDYGQASVYSYVSASPINLVDPSGLEGKSSSSDDEQEIVKIDIYGADFKKWMEESIQKDVDEARSGHPSISPIPPGHKSISIEEHQAEQQAKIDIIDDTRANPGGAAGLAVANKRGKTSYVEKRQCTEIGVAVWSFFEGFSEGAVAAQSSNNATKGGGRLNPLEGTSYTDKVRAQMRPNLKTGRPDNHGFPLEVDNSAGLGRQSKITGGDGVVRTKIELDGSYGSKNGVFEWIIEPDGAVNHRLFRPGGSS
jgi:RHS repeat-associated protein